MLQNNPRKKFQLPHFQLSGSLKQNVFTKTIKIYQLTQQHKKKQKKVNPSKLLSFIFILFSKWLLYVVTAVGAHSKKHILYGS